MSPTRRSAPPRGTPGVQACVGHRTRDAAFATDDHTDDHDERAYALRSDLRSD